MSCIIPDDGLGNKAETLHFDETDLFQSLMTNLSMVGTINTPSFGVLFWVKGQSSSPVQSNGPVQSLQTHLFLFTLLKG